MLKMKGFVTQKADRTTLRITSLFGGGVVGHLVTLT